jgi:hypothetical protein
MKASDRRNITRMDYGRAHGWWVRICRGAGKNKRVVSASFADARLGGKRKALAAAVAWRDRTLKKLAPPRRGGPVTPLGHGYIRRVEIVQRSGDAYAHFEAWIRVGPRRWASTKRSIALWGAREAKRQCEGWLTERRKALGVGRVGLVEAAVGLRVRAQKPPRRRS